ncbi:parallel beta helix pectate lyase-like protein [Arcticibacter pallidicorallinus]|uniref:Parallel beta helix pectate lyase-like protein n=1 Tax=Arcticibacter pallidicorallinus TaxID=1259464 RepID=A0A2T0UBK8_9SPHI|nr:right-handed parallel beta-helix repeat-containing protein [Arcticibacter pallidicorallinus]PRY55325.1 parallel beta helix pectate lyase-like protein [Arcticibacter pallidicorallinus]
MKHAFAFLIAVSLLSCKKDLQEDAVVPVEGIEVTPENPDELANLNVRKKFNISPSTTLNQTNAISALIQNDKKLFFPKGTYIIDDVLQIANVKNVLLVGEKGTIFKTTRNNKVIQISGNVKNLEIRGISFISSLESNRHDTEGMIFVANYGAQDVIDGLLIRGCTFSNPKTHANAIKLISEGENSMVKNIRIIENKFESVGRMGVEFQNHLKSPVKARFRDYSISNNTFHDVGTIQAWPAPSSISVSGYALNGKINHNKITEMRMHTSDYIYYGIENAGTIGLETIGNYMKSSTYGFTGILGSSPSEAESRATGQPMKSNWIIKDNIIELSGRSHLDKIRGMELSHVDGYTVSNNKIYVDGMAIMFVGSKNGNISKNNIRSGGNNVLYFRDNSSANTITQNVIDGSIGEDHGLIMFYGSGVKNNRVVDNKMISTGGRTGVFVNLGGASGNGN